MQRKRALVLAASAAAVLSTGTAVAATNFGLLGATEKQLPAGNLDLATVRVPLDASTTTSPIRIVLEDGVIHVIQPDGSEITIPMPTTEAPATTAATVPTDDHGTSSDEENDDSTTSPTTPEHSSPPKTTTAGTHVDNDHGTESHGGEHDDD